MKHCPLLDDVETKKSHSPVTAFMRVYVYMRIKDEGRSVCSLMALLQCIEIKKSVQNKTDEDLKVKVDVIR